MFHIDSFMIRFSKLAWKGDSMAERKVRWGILGSAGIAKRAMIPGIQGSDTGVLAAIASRDAEKAKETAAQFAIPNWYGSYEELLADPNIDAVYIPLPNHLHREWTIRAAQAGKHVMCEKPAALTADEALEMVQACEKAGVLFAEAFMYRYHPRYERIKQIIESGEIGEVRGLHGTFTFNNAASPENVRFHRSMGGGGLYDVGCYPISAARLILGTEPEAATVHAFLSPKHDYVDMMAAGLLEFPNHVALTFDCAMWAAGRNTLEILGTDGLIELPHAFLGDLDFFVTVKGERRMEKAEKLNLYSLQADSFGRSILDGDPLLFPPMDAVRNMEALDACLKSMNERNRVEVKGRMAQ